jgi:hypothetical protein
MVRVRAFRIGVAELFDAAQLVARQVRRKANLARSCSACHSEPKTVAIKKATAKTMLSNTS